MMWVIITYNTLPVYAFTQHCVGKSLLCIVVVIIYQ